MYGKDEGEYSGAFTPDNENAEKESPSVLANPQIDWNSCIGQQNR
jgi:hypothetical protein